MPRVFLMKPFAPKFPVPDEPPLGFIHPVDPLTWRRSAYVLHLMATVPFAVRYELWRLTSADMGLDIRSGTIKRLFYGLEENGLIVSQLLPLIGNSKFTLVRLSERGRLFCEELGWQPVENEWERVTRIYSGKFPERTLLMILEFAYQARLRGGIVEVAPHLDTETSPHIRMEQGGARMLVEIVTSLALDFDRLQVQQRIQGSVCLCTLNPGQRERIINECKYRQMRGKATDIVSLILDTKSGNPGALWIQNWVW
jgi:hypothetical protein